MNVLQDYLKNKGVQLLTQTINSADDRLHSHLFFEIFYITSKSVLHEVNGRKSTLSVGDICFMRPGDSHIFRRERGNDSTHRDVLISADLAQRACDFLDDTFYKIIFSADRPFTFKLSQEEFNRFNEELSDFSRLQASSVDIDLSYREKYLAVMLFHSLLSR